MHQALYTYHVTLAPHIPETFAPPAACEVPVTISERYLLVSNIPIWRLDDGSLAAPPLWVKDLREHTAYLPGLRLAAPLAWGPPSELLESLSGLPIEVTLLPSPRSTLRALFALPRTIARLWRAVGNADIVHSGVAGWPIPLGWLAVPIARLRRKFIVVVVESAPWRQATSRKAKLRATLFERFARWCVGSAHLSIFTQPQYRDSLLTHRPERGHIIHASWIDADRVLTDAQAAQSWRDKPAVLSLLFAGRLIEDKGVLVLLQAMKDLSSRGFRLNLDILGTGDLADQCTQAAARLGPHIQLRMLGTLPYDQRFFDLIRSYHAIVVPSLGDEQPRIVYDAYSQAVSIIASDTPGLRDCIAGNITGQLVPKGNASALADTIAASTIEMLERLGLTALETARAMTHRSMHTRRAHLLRQALHEKYK